MRRRDRDNISLRHCLSETLGRKHTLVEAVVLKCAMHEIAPLIALKAMEPKIIFNALCQK